MYFCVCVSFQVVGHFEQSTGAKVAPKEICMIGMIYLFDYKVKC